MRKYQNEAFTESNRADNLKHEVDKLKRDNVWLIDELIDLKRERDHYMKVGPIQKD